MHYKSNILKKIIAIIIDYFFVMGITLILLFVFGKPDEHGEYALKGIYMLFPISFWFTYTVVVEQISGATLGNNLVGLKPVSLNELNKKITLTQSILRHLLDPLDLSLWFITIIIMIISEKKQRLGDMLANTVVINVKNNDKLNEEWIND